MTYKANSKHVMDIVDGHIRAYYDDNDADLVADLHAVNDNASALVEGGNFLISYYDQRIFLDNLELNNNSGREFSDDDVFKMYVLLVSRGIDRIARKVAA